MTKFVLFNSLKFHQTPTVMAFTGSAATTIFKTVSLRSIETLLRVFTCHRLMQISRVISSIKSSVWAFKSLHRWVYTVAIRLSIIQAKQFHIILSTFRLNRNINRTLVTTLTRFRGIHIIRIERFKVLILISDMRASAWSITDTVKLDIQPLHLPLPQFIGKTSRNKFYSQRQLLLRHRVTRAAAVNGIRWLRVAVDQVASEVAWITWRTTERARSKYNKRLRCFTRTFSIKFTLTTTCISSITRVHIGSIWMRFKTISFSYRHKTFTFITTQRNATLTSTSITLPTLIWIRFTRTLGMSHSIRFTFKGCSYLHLSLPLSFLVCRDKIAQQLHFAICAEEKLRWNIIHWENTKKRLAFRREKTKKYGNNNEVKPFGIRFAKL